MSINLGAFKAGMTKELLDHLYLHPGLQQVRCYRVPESVKGWSLALHAATAAVTYKPPETQCQRLVSTISPGLVNEKSIAAVFASRK